MFEITRFNDLEELEDITYQILFEDEPSIFTEEYAVEIVESALYLMDDYMKENTSSITEPNFKEILLEDIKEIFYVQMEEHIDNLDDGDDIEDDMNDILEDAFNIFITTFHTERSMETESTTIVQNKIHENKIDENKIDEYKKIIQGLRDVPQPVQRTPEWYQFRWNLITASNAWKAFQTQ